MLTQWFKNLEKREQRVLLAGLVAVVFYLAYGVVYQGLVQARDRAARLNNEQHQTLLWVRGAVQTIASLRRSSATVNIAGKSLAQLAEEAARDASVRLARFQPSGDNEAQVWLERENFNGVLAFLSRMEVDYGLMLEDVAITSANSPGIVNVRLKFAR